MIANGVDKIVSIEARKKYGLSENFGRAHFGYCAFGQHNEFAGIYRVVRNSQGRLVQRMVFYFPPQTDTPAKLASQAKFATAIANWQGFTSDQKKVYNKKARARRIGGYNFYISEYMKS